MTEHLSPQQIEHLLGETSPSSEEERRVLDDHLAECAECRQRFRSALRTAMPSLGAVWGSSQETKECLSREEMAQYVRGECDAFGTESVQMHLEDCFRCRGDVEALERFQAGLEAPQNEIVPVSEPATSSEHKAPDPPALAWWKRWRSAFSLPKQGRSLAFSGLAAACVGLFFYMRQAALETQLHIQRQEWIVARKEHEKVQGELAQARAERDQHAAALEQQIQDLSAQKAETTQRLKQAQDRVQAMAREIAHQGQRRASDPVLIASAVSTYDSFLQSAALRGSNDRDDARKSPRNEIVESAQPEFQWKPYRNAVRYEIHLHVVSRKDGSLKELVTAVVKAPRTKWQSPRPLPRGQQYVWYVEAYNAGDSRIDVRGGETTDAADTVAFSVLDALTAAQLERFAHQPFTRGLLYANAGLYRQAETILTTYGRQHPGDKARVTEALRQIRLRREEVAGLFRKADSPQSP